MMCDRRRSFIRALILFCSASPAFAAAPGDVSQLRVPDGFVVERVAGPPLVEFPMNGGFDERGRLFVTENAGVNLDFAKLKEQLPNRVIRLEDADGDGVFDKRTVFADKLTFPTGALWHQGALYVCSPPGLWKFTDANDDGVADTREQIVTGFGSTGNAADLHGPFLGPEGWLYFCDGRNGHDVTLGDGTKWKGKAACVYRCKTDGTGLEVVFGGGFDNPVEVAFTPEGEPLVNVNLVQSQPFRVDAIIYGIEGSNYPHDGAWRELKRTGEFQPTVGDLGWVATSGFMRYRGRSLGGKYVGKYFSTEFNTRRVRSHLVERDGAGFKVSHDDFLTTDLPDFRPTDVLEDADGSLLVIDTGGWFRIGCPNSQIAKPEVQGAIYRVRRKDAEKIDDPRGLKLDWAGVKPSVLADRLDDRRPAVVERAVDTLASTPRETLYADGEFNEKTRVWVTSNAFSDRARLAVWVFARSDGQNFASSLYGAASGPAKLAALRAIGLNRDRLSLSEVLSCLKGDAASAREAAIALGRIGDPKSVAPLLGAAADASGDRFLDHAITFALIRIADRDATLAGLSHMSPATRRVALVALDQMDGGKLTADLVTPHLASDDARLRETALTIAASHPQWADQVAPTIRAALAHEVAEKDAEALRAAMIAFARAPAMQAVVGDALAAGNAPARNRLLLLQVAAEAGVSPLPDTWVEPLRRSLRDTEGNVAAQAIAVVRSVAGDQFDADLLSVARDESRPAEFRLAALAAVLPRAKAVEASDFQFLTSELGSAKPPLSRLNAAQALAAAPLDDAQLAHLATLVAGAGAIELPALVPAFERSSDAAVGAALVKALDASKSIKSVSPAALTHAVAKYPAEVKDAAAKLVAKINPDAEAQKAKLAEYEPLLTGGSANRGQSVFFGKASACATCHAVRGQGAHVGPDLSKIAAIRTGRDLLESVVFPSASFARGYESFVVQTKAGQTYAGTLAGESADAVVLRTPAEVRVPRSAVKTIRQDRVSIMPQGLEASLSREDLADLMAFLQSLK